MDEPAVTYYQMAAARKGSATTGKGNRYLTAETWPPPAARPTRFYLREGRRLSTAAPEAGGGAESYTFDPAQPVPTVGGPNLTLPIGPMDQRAIPCASRPIRSRATSRSRGSSTSSSGSRATRPTPTSW
jgi:predicted acyl esterase